MSSDIVLNVLQSHDFVTVDQPLFSAIDLYGKTVNLFEHMPPYVMEQLHAAQKSGDLAVKRVCWLILLVMMPEMQSYALSVGDPVKTPRLLTWLTSEAERLFDGTYQSRHGDESLSAFLVNANNVYDGMEVIGG